MYIYIYIYIYIYNYKCMPIFSLFVSISFFISTYVEGILFCWPWPWPCFSSLLEFLLWDPSGKTVVVSLPFFEGKNRQYLKQIQNLSLTSNIWHIFRKIFVFWDLGLSCSVSMTSLQKSQLSILIKNDQTRPPFVWGY